MSPPFFRILFVFLRSLSNYLLFLKNKLHVQATSIIVFFVQ